MILAHPRAMPFLNSSAILAANYNAATMLLFITFRHGKTYPYFGVPEWIYIGLITAPSAGAFYNAFIRGRFGP